LSEFRIVSIVLLVLQSDPNEPNGPDIDAKIDKIKKPTEALRGIGLVIMLLLCSHLNMFTFLRLPKSKLRLGWSAFMLMEVNRLNSRLPIF
jgi:hypothetical protein